MALTDIRAEIELIQTEARRMAPSEAEFMRRFPTMAARLKSLLEQRDRLDGEASTSRPTSPEPAAPRTAPPANRAPRVVGPTRRPTSFLDLREELLEGDATATSEPAFPAAAAPDLDDGRLRKELAARDAEIRRLREERDDWRGKAEGAEGRLTRGAEIARRLEESLSELDTLRARVAELESTAAHADDATETATELRTEVDHLRHEQEAMQAAHHQELERLRERHRQEIESWIERENERAQLEARVASLESELASARSGGEQARESLERERARLHEELDAARAEGAAGSAERERLSHQLEAATLDRNVVSVGILQAVQRLAERIEEDPRYGALPEGDPVLGDLRRSLFQDLERFAQHARAIGTDMGAEAFLHAIGDRLDAIPEWVGGLLEAITRLNESSRMVLSARDEEMRQELAAREQAEARATTLESRVGELETALADAARDAREQATDAAGRLTALDADLAAARASVSSLEADLASTRTRLSELEAEHRAQLEASASLDQRARRDAAELQRLEEALEETERRKAELESELTATRHGLSTAQTRIGEIEKSLAEAVERAAQADREALELGNALAEARARVAAFEQTIERVARELTASLTDP
ncbi:MAG: hypothetical protein U0610_08985 [bacterium]